MAPDLILEASAANLAQNSSSTRHTHQLANSLAFVLKLSNSRTPKVSVWKTHAKSHSTHSSFQTAQSLAAQSSLTSTWRNDRASACLPDNHQMPITSVRKNALMTPFQSLTLKQENSTALLSTALQDSTLRTPKFAAETT